MPVRFINDRYALSPNPRSGGMADVYRARDYDREEPGWFSQNCHSSDSVGGGV